MKIITPSYKRAGDMKTVNIFGDDLIIAVHEFEIGEYQKEYPRNEFLQIPDSERGNMAKVRNFILNSYVNEEIIMIDDDVSKIGFHEKGIMTEAEKEHIMMFFEDGFQISKDIGTIMFGVNLQADPKFYREYSPFSFLSPVLGTFTCINNIDVNIRYDERLGLNEDYDLFIQVMNKYRKVYRNNKWFYIADHLKDEGGCCSYRIMDEERKQAAIMEKKWGKNICRYKIEEDTNPRINIPISGI